MANNFSTLKLNQTLEKFNLVRFEPGRFVNDDLSDIGGGQYTISMPGFVISKVEENGSELTLVSSGLSSGEYTFNESTGLLSVHPTSAPSSTNAIVVYYYLFYTSSKYQVLYQDPEDDSTTKRDWRPRMRSVPTIENSVKNILSGVLTINSSSISLINSEGDLNVYFGANDSWYNKNVKIWVCLNSTENIQKVFEGVVTQASIDLANITVNIEDTLSNFDAPAFMGDDRSEVYVTTDDYADVLPNRANSAIPFMFGTLSRYETIPESVTNLTTAEKIDPLSLYYATCIDYSTNVTTTTNREWIACRTADGYLDFSCTPSNIDNSDGNFTRLDVTAGEAANFHIGDTFNVDKASTDYPVRVYYVDRANNYVYVTKSGTISTGDVIEASIIPTVIVTDENDENYYLLYGRDYSATETATSGGNYIYQITLADNFETNHGLTTLDPGTHYVKFRIKPDATNIKHGSVLKKLVESVGLTVNSTSITDANTALTSNANFSIPQYDETDFHEYYKYIELLLSSSFGYIFLNNSFEIEYGLFSTPSSSTALTDIDIIRNTFKMSVEYKDIITQLIGYNIHYTAAEVKALPATPSVTETSTKARYLHGVDRTIRFRHVLEDMSSRLSDIMNFRSERLVTYNFKTANKNLDTLIGDDYQLEKSGLLGSDTSRDVTLIKTNKSTNSVSISAIDLIGV